MPYENNCLYYRVSQYLKAKIIVFLIKTVIIRYKVILFTLRNNIRTFC